MSLVGQAVQQRQGEALIAKDLGRVPSGRGKLEIGRNDEGHQFIQGGAELEHQLGTSQS